MSQFYVDCPECGIERVLNTVSRCSACEVAERYEKRLDALHAALLRYGRHDSGCLTKKSPGCKCGLHEAMDLRRTP